MIVKDCDKSINLLKLEALNRRCPVTHLGRPRIDADLTKMLSGYIGENSINYHLSFLDQDKFSIFHGLRLKDPMNRYFQLDILLVAPTFLTIVEVKNFGGKLYFNREPAQLIQTTNEKEIAYKDPILQVIRQQRQLQAWLDKNKFPPIPIVYFVLLANSNTIIQFSPDYQLARRCVILPDSLPLKIESITSQFKEEILTNKDLRRLSRLLIKGHEPLNSNLLNRYNISQNELLKGVHCPNCQKLAMTKKYAHWKCLSCSFSSKHAYIYSILDYALLVGPTINSRQLGEFLQVQSDSVARKLLTSLELSKVGKRKNRHYELSIKVLVELLSSIARWG